MPNEIENKTKPENKLGERLRFYREKAKLSQMELARRSLVENKCISRTETGSGSSGKLPDPRCSTIQKLAKALGISAGVLLDD